MVAGGSPLEQDAGKTARGRLRSVFRLASLLDVDPAASDS